MAASMYYAVPVEATAHSRDTCRYPWFPLEAVGVSILLPPSDGLEATVGPLTTMTSQSIHGLGFKGGEFTILNGGAYSIRFLGKIHATSGNEGSSITLGVSVNDSFVKTKECSFAVDEGNCMYPALFQGEELFSLHLKAGDRVSLQVVAINLPEGAKAYFMEGRGEEQQPSAELSLHLRRPRIETR